MHASALVPTLDHTCMHMHMRYACTYTVFVRACVQARCAVAELTAQLAAKAAAAERAEGALRALEQQQGRSELNVQSGTAACHHM